MKVTVVLEPSEEGGYTVTVPTVPGCISEGNTKTKALANIREALSLFLELDEKEIPRDKPGILVETLEM